MAESQRVGQQIGRYRISRRIGRGGLGEVYLAEDVRLQRQVAIKTFLTQPGQEEISNFSARARQIALLDHPHLVPVFDFGTDEAEPHPIQYMVTKYMPGGSLRDRHPKGTQSPLMTVISYVRQVAGALQYAHEKDTLHGNLKPSKFLLNERGDILLSDIGELALLQGDTENVMGTAAYMAPEQLQAKSQAASDQYALGIIVYEWLTGAAPFSGRSPMDVAIQHSNTPPPSLRASNPALSPYVEEVVFHALAKDPKDRFASVQAFANALASAAGALRGATADETLIARPGTPGARGDDEVRSKAIPLPSPGLPAEPGGAERSWSPPPGHAQTG